MLVEEIQPVTHWFDYSYRLWPKSKFYNIRIGVGKDLDTWSTHNCGVSEVSNELVKNCCIVNLSLHPWSNPGVPHRQFQLYIRRKPWMNLNGGTLGSNDDAIEERLKSHNDFYNFRYLMISWIFFILLLSLKHYATH